MRVIVEQDGKWKHISLDEFERDYGIHPRITGPEFYCIYNDGANLYIGSHPNVAVLFDNGVINYIIYKGAFRQIINGVEIPPAEFIPEQSCFASYQEAVSLIEEKENSERGTCWIDTKDGQRIMLERLTPSER